MDNNTFTAVSWILTGAGALGSAVGINHLIRDREADRARIEAKIETDINPRSERVKSWSEDVYDYARSVSTIASSTVYGLVVYPLVPPVFLPGLLYRDLAGSGHAKSIFKRFRE